MWRVTGPVVSDSSSPVLRVLGILVAVGAAVAVVVGGGLLLFAGGDDDGDDVETASSTPAEEEPAGGEPSAPITTTPAPTTTVPVELDLLRVDPRPAVDGWLAAAGRNASAVEVILYPDYAFLEVRDPDRPARTLDFGWRDGEVEGPEPATPFPGTDLDAESFPLARVAWDALPRLVAGAPSRAGIPRGEVTHVIVHSDAPFSSRFLFRIYVTGPNGASDYVVATIDGRPAAR